ncbi:hypothetical protein H5410_060535 [Solanum commersonii]|uniref:DUF4283 domain-containing protein n=1 Tax=Solanum commersonii TaxID=4109 RepID=A0A9J5W5P8_SOLCO|nr:hypothetical protein H5410_060535 [Solanum commersonii]
MAVGQLSTEAGHLSMSYFSHLNPNMPIINPSLPIGKSYINSITNGTPTSESIALKEILYVEGVPCIQWTEAEVDTMNKIENLQYAVIRKFTYDLADLEELRMIIPKQYFVNLISKGAYYIECKDGYSYLMHTLMYDARLKTNKETTMAMTWISFPNLLPTFFTKECLSSLASAVGKPAQLDLETINKTRLSCAREIVVPETEIGEKGEEKREDAMDKTERLWVHQFKKGKAWVLLSGLVIGDPSTWKSVKSNRFPSLGEETTDKVTTDANTSSANVPNLVNTDNESTKDWVNQVFDKTSTDLVKGLDVKEVLANDNDNKQQSAEDNSGIENDCNSEQVKNIKVIVFQSHQVVHHTDEVGIDKAVIMVPNQTYVIQENQAKSVSEVEYRNEEMNCLPLEADSSPKLLKSSRKGKKQTSGVENQSTRANCHGKIWCFVNSEFDIIVVKNPEQQLTLCSKHYQQKEKNGRLPVQDVDHEDFDICIHSCELAEIQFKGSPFTWWNRRTENDCIFERLDIILSNQLMQNWFTHMEVEYFARTRSDHAPMLLHMEEV